MTREWTPLDREPPPENAEGRPAMAAPTIDVPTRRDTGTVLAASPVYVAELHRRTETGARLPTIAGGHVDPLRDLAALPLPVPPCPGWCRDWGLEDLTRIARDYGRCPCSQEAQP